MMSVITKGRVEVPRLCSLVFYFLILHHKCTKFLTKNSSLKLTSCHIVIDSNLLQDLFNCYEKVTFLIKYRFIKLDKGVVAVMIDR